MPSYISRIEFEGILNDKTVRFKPQWDSEGRYLLEDWRLENLGNGKVVEPGRKMDLYYHFSDWEWPNAPFIPAAVYVYDEIDNAYRELLPDHVQKWIYKFIKK